MARPELHVEQLVPDCQFRLLQGRFRESHGTWRFRGESLEECCKEGLSRGSSVLSIEREESRSSCVFQTIRSGFGVRSGMELQEKQVASFVHERMVEICGRNWNLEAARLLQWKRLF